MRENTNGVHFERCRYTVTMEVYGSYPAQTTEPPAGILAEIKKRAA
jgi:sarcosine oxidase subunit delta